MQTRGNGRVDTTNFVSGSNSCVKTSKGPKFNAIFDMNVGVRFGLCGKR